MQRSMEPVPGAGVKNYVFLVYSTDEEVVDTNNVLAKLISGESENSSSRRSPSWGTRPSSPPRIGNTHT